MREFYRKIKIANKAQVTSYSPPFGWPSPGRSVSQASVATCKVIFVFISEFNFFVKSLFHFFLQTLGFLCTKFEPYVT